jgi:hypothetical protein
MSPRRRRRLSELLTGAASLSFPKARRDDRRAVRDCAREAVAAEGLRRLPRESLSLAAAGMRTRAGLAAREMWHAPWRDALTVLALPLAATLLLIWTFRFMSSYDHWPLDKGLVVLLGGSLTAVVGAALRRRLITVAGALAVFVTAASPYLGFGTGTDLAGTPSFYRGSGVDIGVASLLPTLLLVAAGLSLPRSPLPLRDACAGLAAGLGPALIAAVYLFPGPAREPTYMHLIGQGPGRSVHVETTVQGPPYPWPWIPDSKPLLRILGVALAVAVALAWRTARTRPAWALASGLVLASVAYPLVWTTLHAGALAAPYWLYNGAYPLLLAAAPFLLALMLVRRAGRASAAVR